VKNAPSQIGLLGDRKDEFLGIRIPIWSHVLGFKASLVVLIPMGLVFVYGLLEKHLKKK